MESLTWLLTFLVLGAWLAVGIGLLLHPPAVPGGWGSTARRLFWGFFWAAALVAGSWGPHLWSRTAGDYPNDPAVGAVASRTTASLRTPVALRSSTRDLDAEARVVRAEERLVLQLPVALLVFFGIVYVLRSRERRSSMLLALALALVPLAACQPGQGGEDAPRPERAIVEASWDTLVHIRVEPEDTLLYSANHVVASERGLWVLDRIGYRVAHFDWHGELRWYAGSQGAGPGEFLNPRMLQLADDGRVWVLDIGTHRITGIASDGTPDGEVSLQPLEGVLHVFASDAAGERFYGMLADERLLPVAVDREGRVERGRPIRVADADGAFGIALQGVASGALRGEDWVYAFSMGDGLFRMRGLDLLDSRVRYPEWVPFPGVARREEEAAEVLTTTTQLTEPNFSAAEVAVTEERILVRFRGTSPEAGRLLDVFDLETGGYIETLLLPRSGRLAAWGDRIILAWDQPAPQVAVLRRR
jgi:hypothetical protein